MKAKLYLPSLIVFLTLVLSSCATVGNEFSYLGSSSITIDKTTKQDVFKMYGEPFRVGHDNGDMRWTYGLYKYRVFGETETKDLIITFDHDGIVKSYTYNSSFKQDKSKFLHVND
ncbi:MAG: outer membrane protein assembly factor BamE [Bacteriovoracaceae bacterium]|nr:outer membrane protein assembly factor BamE [Bacteriovoracaceae bacterium]